MGETFAELDGEVGVGLAEEDGAEAAGSGGDEEAAERAVGGGVVDGLAGATGLHGGGAHAEGLVDAFVEAGGGAEAGFVDCVGDGEFGGADFFAEAGFALLAGEVAGGDAEDAFEAALEGELAEAGGGGEVVQRGALAVCSDRKLAARAMASAWGSGFGVVRWGSQRRQGRKPAASASAGVGKKLTFLRSGVRLAQEGRQKMPVDFTA